MDIESGGAVALDWFYRHRERWFSFVRELMLTGVLLYLARWFHSPFAYAPWVVSVVFLLVPIVRAIAEGTRAAFEKLPWAWMETLPRYVSYPAVTVLSLTAAVAVFVATQYTVLQISNVVEAIAKSHVQPG